MKKNLLSVLTALALVSLAAWLVRLPIVTSLDLLTLVLPTTVLALAIEDMWRKALCQCSRQSLTWQYYVMIALIPICIIAWFWAYKAVTVASMLIRLGVTLGLVALDLAWHKGIYKKSILTAAQKAQHAWAKYRRKLATWDKEHVSSFLSEWLRYRLIGNSLDGDLDISIPLCSIDGRAMTLKELTLLHDTYIDGGKDVTDIAIAGQQASEYIKALTSGLSKEEQ